MKSVDDRFWGKVNRGQPDACWEFTGGRHERDDYGLFYRYGKLERAHRVAWELVNGIIPEGMIVCHECDNPPCCNPAHLFLGTKKRNMEDAKEKNRHAMGSRHGRAKMDEELVLLLRQKHALGIDVGYLAGKYNLGYQSVLSAVSGITWKHVPMVPKHPKA